jgi:HK97 family phage portal protein
MGFLNAFRITNDEPFTPGMSVRAATLADIPYSGLSSAWGFPGEVPSVVTITREQAMTVPAVARARGILAGSIGTIPMETYNKITGAHVTNRTLIEQPDPALPRVNTISWLVDDLLFHGAAYLQVLDVSLEDGRPYRARRINPGRVTWNVNSDGTMITGYNVDTNPVPHTGLNSLIVFQGIEEGLIARAGRTLKTAIELEQASYRMASEPVPQMVLMNEGMNLPGDQVAGLMDTFKRARRERSTAYVEGPIKLEVVGLDSAQMQMVEARQFLSAEIARTCGIPAWYLNAESASMTYSNVTAERRSLLDFGLRPFIAILEERLSMDDVTPRNQVVRFDIDDFLRGNPIERVDVTIKLLDAGIIDIDEAREMEDLAPRGTTEAPEQGTTPPSQTREIPTQ